MRYAKYNDKPDEPASFSFPITPADAALPKLARMLFVGGSGNLEVTLANDYQVSGIATTAVNTTAETITIPNHGFVAGDRVMVATSNTLPAGLAVQTAYFVLVTDANTIQLSATSGGAAINLTTVGVGTLSVFKTTQIYNAAAGYHNLCCQQVNAATAATHIVGLY